MARKNRDRAAEYRRRIARGLARGLSRSQARGHPRIGERHISAKAAGRKSDLKLLEGIKALRKTRSLRAAAQRVKTSPERLRRFARSLDFVAKRGGRYTVGEDNWIREVQVISGGRRSTIAVRGYEPARVAGSHRNAVGEFWASNDPTYLTPFDGVQVTDTRGKTYTLETRPNVLYRLAAQGGDSFEHVYRIIV